MRCQGHTGGCLAQGNPGRSVAPEPGQCLGARPVFLLLPWTQLVGTLSSRIVRNSGHFDKIKHSNTLFICFPPPEVSRGPQVALPQKTTLWSVLYPLHQKKGDGGPTCQGVRGFCFATTTVVTDMVWLCVPNQISCRTVVLAW